VMPMMSMMPFPTANIPSPVPLEEQQKLLLQQVMNLRDDEIELLPPEQKAAVQTVRQTILMNANIGRF